MDMWLYIDRKEEREVQSWKRLEPVGLVIEIVWTC